MHLLAFTSVLIVAAAGLCQAQADSATDNAADHWCGEWAGSPVPADVPTPQLLPPPDYTKRFFVEPQLLRTPFAPIMASESKVQVPKLWGNNNFRIALMSYKDSQRIYSSSKSSWREVKEGLDLVMEKCVSKGTGGASLVPPSPGLTQGTLVIYAYATGSYFDFQMNYYMSTPYGINPALIRATYLEANGSFVPPAIDVL